jgi:Xaa-Pro aminopeptidase
MRLSSRLILLLLLPTTLLAPALHGLDRQPSADYHNRRVRLSGALNQGIAVVFAADEPLTDFTPYRQDPDFYYLTGWNEPGAALLIEGPAIGEDLHTVRSYREILFLPTPQRAHRALQPAPSSTPPRPTPCRPPALPEVLPMTELPTVLGTLLKSDRYLEHSLWSQPCQHPCPRPR